MGGACFPAYILPWRLPRKRCLAGTTVPRSKTSGIPISSEDFVNEKKVVVDWGSQLPGIPDDTQSRLIRSYCAEDPDIEAHI